MKVSERDIKKWETGELGATEESVRLSSLDKSHAVDEALGMQLISIRLQKKLVADLKRIADHYEIGYQPMVRDLLNRFAQSELKMILREELQDLEAEQQASEAESTKPVNRFIQG